MKHQDLKAHEEDSKIHFPSCKSRESVESVLQQVDTRINLELDNAQSKIQQLESQVIQQLQSRFQKGTTDNVCVIS